MMVLSAPRFAELQAFLLECAPTVCHYMDAVVGTEKGYWEDSARNRICCKQKTEHEGTPELPVVSVLYKYGHCRCHVAGFCCKAKFSVLLVDSSRNRAFDYQGSSPYLTYQPVKLKTSLYSQSPPHDIDNNLRRPMYTIQILQQRWRSFMLGFLYSIFDSSHVS